MVTHSEDDTTVLRSVLATRWADHGHGTFPVTTRLPFYFYYSCGKLVRAKRISNEHWKIRCLGISKGRINPHSPSSDERPSLSKVRSI